MIGAVGVWQLKAFVLPANFAIAPADFVGAPLSFAKDLWKRTPFFQGESQQLSERVLFIGELYQVIQTKYWRLLLDDQLAELFLKAANHVTEKEQALVSKDRQGVMALAEGIVGDESRSEAEKDQVIAQWADVVLANLQPFGRSRLFSTNQAAALKNTVDNVRPDSNYFEALEVSPDASAEAVQQAYAEKSQELAQAEVPAEEKQALQEELDRAQVALSTPEDKQRYAETKVEPTIQARLVNPDVYYIKITQFSPTTTDDLDALARRVSGSAPTALIIDLRGNIGGTIDGLPYFLGPFIGLDQYAYQFLSQGHRTDFKTKTGFLASFFPFKKVVVLVDGATQSTAEVMTAVLKRYQVGVVIGSTTAGWGTVERVFPLSQQFSPDTEYSAFLVHSLTLREDGEPIQGNGVQPDILFESAGWQKQLLEYYNFQPLVQAVEAVR